MRVIFEATAELASLAIFSGMIAVWALVLY